MDNRLSRHIGAALLAGSLLSAALLYLGVLNNGFVADTWVFVTPRTLGNTLSYFFRSIIPDEWEALWLRPIPMLFFWLDGKIWPNTISGPHLVNLLAHIVNMMLIWRITRFTLRDNDTRQGAVFPAFIATLVYGLHPLAAGSVGWVAARFDVMNITFGLAGLDFWIRHTASRKDRRNLIKAILFLTLCLLSKEQGVVFFATAILYTLSGWLFTDSRDRVRLWDVASLAGVIGVYLVWRISVFGGYGGYLTARYGLNPALPVYYAVAVLYPFESAAFDWHAGMTFFAALAAFTGVVSIARLAEPDRERTVNPRWLITAAGLFIMGLMTTMPHAGMTLPVILRHGEARFALVAVTGFAFLTGWLVHSIGTSTKACRIILALVFVWGIASLWRTDIQIQAWDRAGKTAADIITQTQKLVPRPPMGSVMIFVDIPRENSHYAYIYGIGLEEAIHHAYGRSDFKVIRYPKRADFGKANPARDAVLQYHKGTGVLERLHGEKRKRNGNVQ